jgi:hypothetical protein
MVKAKETYLDKYGCEHSSQNNEVKEKLKQTCIKKYGCESSLQNEKVKDKIKQTCIEKYGYDNPLQNEEVKDKIKQTCLEKYGYDNPFENKLIQEKCRQTCFKNYGVEHPTQNIEIMEKCSKNAYKLKEFIFPSGKINKVQGAEPFALKELLEIENINEDEIILGCKNVPTIWYNDENGKKHRHYVDIFIPSQNRLIEVKSTWTLQKKQDSVFLKQKAGKELGYKYEIWVYDGKRNKIQTYE